MDDQIYASHATGHAAAWQSTNGDFRLAQNLVIVRFFPKAGSFEAAKAILAEMVTNTRREPGCLVYDLYETADPEGDGEILCLIEKYRDESAVSAHREAQYYKEYRANIMNHLRKPIEISILSDVDVA